MIRCSPCAAV
ncbi:hypothetical protein HY479_02810 [Candidatus Uhrbacteria bacterium]|nr:hypothetical protein [Candidatus Uhrbacteria bacterium]